MSLVQDIERAVAGLSEEDLRAFRAWFAEHDARAWDKQFEQDVASGKFDAMAAEALADLRDGRSTEL